jgi:hypothetical protein
MTMKSTAIFGVLIACALALAAPACADPPSNLYQQLESGHQTRPAGVLRGVIEAVDYSGGTLVLRTSKGPQQIAIVPSTTIYNGNDYATLSDLRKGQNAEIAVVEVDGRLVAQSIRLK